MSALNVCSISRVEFRVEQTKFHTEGYRSGHNGAVLKTVWAQAHRRSNRLPSAKISAASLYVGSFLMFLRILLNTLKHWQQAGQLRQ